MRVRNHVVVGDLVDVLEFADQIRQRPVLCGGQRLVVIAAHFNADRKLVHVGPPVPHAASGVVGLAAMVDNAVDATAFIDAVVTFAEVAQLPQRAARGRLRGMQNDQRCRLAHRPLAIARTVIPVIELDHRPRLCRDQPETGKPQGKHPPSNHVFSPFSPLGGSQCKHQCGSNPCFQAFRRPGYFQSGQPAMRLTAVISLGMVNPNNANTVGATSLSLPDGTSFTPTASFAT